MIAQRSIEGLLSQAKDSDGSMLSLAEGNLDHLDKSISKWAHN